MRSPCRLTIFIPSTEFLKAGMVKPEEMAIAVPCKCICDMIPEDRNRAARKLLLRSGITQLSI
jgi:hypothetical protein